jgi:hypothetical protein
MAEIERSAAHVVVVLLTPPLWLNSEVILDGIVVPLIIRTEGLHGISASDQQLIVHRPVIGSDTSRSAAMS